MHSFGMQPLLHSKGRSSPINYIVGHKITQITNNLSRND